jgi:hypothetical protein
MTAGGDSRRIDILHGAESRVCCEGMKTDDGVEEARLMAEVARILGSAASGFARIPLIFRPGDHRFLIGEVVGHNESGLPPRESSADGFQTVPSHVSGGQRLQSIRAISRHRRGHLVEERRAGTGDLRGRIRRVGHDALVHDILGEVNVPQRGRHEPDFIPVGIIQVHAHEVGRNVEQQGDLFRGAHAELVQMTGRVDRVGDFDEDLLPSLLPFLSGDILEENGEPALCRVDADIVPGLEPVA